MIITDKIYGQFEVESVLAELISSKPIQRLKGIHQGGASYLVNNDWDVTRFDHSLGVMLLIRKLGGSIEEQIAGLLHDVSHTAFSHVVDAVLNYQNEDYHETLFQDVIINSEIPSILRKHHYDVQILFDISRWTLLEQDAPALCADRVDYTLRDMFTYGFITMEEIESFLQQLKVYQGKMYVESITSAEWFVETYYQEVIGFFMDPLNIYAYDVLTRILKISLEHQILSQHDFMKTDNELIVILKSSNNQEVLELLNHLHPNINIKVDANDFDIFRRNKVRLIDPFLYMDGELVKASHVSDRVRKIGDKAFDYSTTGMYIKVLQTK
ncbi:HD domain-containing protein [Lysinibacillus sp. NPDC097195]|uniref:HD domain-containing protein n=1 Tax=Lysinibacillus sp. NPDC097195 TaxID=3364141 RepID=UPI00380DC0F4